MKPNWSLNIAGRENTQPDWDDIARGLKGLPKRDSISNYLILNKNGAAWEDISCSYLQTYPREGVWVVEYQDGVAGRHFVAYIETDQIPGLFRSYWKDDDCWLDLVMWRDISALFKHLRPHLPAEELASSFFEPGEWEAALEAKKVRDEEFWQEWDEEK